MVGINFPDWGCRIPVLSLSVWPRLTLPLKHDCCPTLPSIAHTSFHRVFFLGVSGIPSIPLWVVFFRRFLPRTYVILKSNVKLFWHRNCRRRHSFNLSLHQNRIFLHQKFFSTSSTASTDTLALLGTFLTVQPHHFTLSPIFSIKFVSGLHLPHHSPHHFTLRYFSNFISAPNYRPSTGFCLFRF